MKKGLIIGLLLCITVSAKTYLLQPDLSTIAFSVNYLNTFNIEGRFSESSGTLRTDRDDELTRIRLKIEADSLSIGSEDTTDFAQGEKALYVKKYKSIQFKSMKIVEEGDGYLVDGILDIRGVARRLKFPVVLNRFFINDEEYISFTHSRNLVRDELKMSYDLQDDDGNPYLSHIIAVDLNLVWKEK